MARLGYFIRRRGDECSIVKVLPNGGEEILEHGLTPAHAETLYFICIGEPVRHEKSRSTDAGADDGRLPAGDLDSSRSSSEILPRPADPGRGFHMRVGTF
jgi:hypothetical protein